MNTCEEAGRVTLAFALDHGSRVEEESGQLFQSRNPVQAIAQVLCLLIDDLLVEYQESRPETFDCLLCLSGADHRDNLAA